MADLTLTADISSIRDAEKALKRFSDASEKLGRSVLNIANKVQSVSSGWDQANKLYEKGVLNSKALAAAQTELARELAVVNGYTKTNGALNTQRALAELRAAQAARENARTTGEAARAAQQAAARQNDLRMRYQEGYTTFARARQEMRGLREAMRAGIITTDQYQERVRLLREEMNRSGDAAQGAGRRFSRSGVLIQQTGYQVGDFLVQIQSGTNAFVAFGQQATQLVGTLTLLGGKWILIGSVLGIAIPLITAVAAAFMRTREAASETEDKLLNLSQSLDQFDAIQRRVSHNIKSNLEVAFKDSADAVGDLLSRINELDFKAAMAPIKDSLDDLSIGVDRVDIALDTLVGFRKLIDQGETLDRVQQALYDNAQNLVSENLSLAISVEEVQKALDEIGKARSTEDLIDAIAKAKEELEKFGGPVAQDALDQLIELAREAGVAEAVMERLADAAARLGDELSFAASLPAGIAARAVRIGVESGAIPPHALQDLPQTDADKAYQRILENRRREARKPSSPSRGKGGGGGGKDPAQSAAEYLEKLKKEAEFKLQLVGLSEQEQRGMEIKKQYLETLEQDNRALTDAEQSRIDAILKSEEALRKATEAEQRREKIQQSITSNIEDALMSLVEGTASVEDAFKTMLRNILLEIFRQQVATPIAKGIASFFAADGAVLSRGNVVPFANGGVVGSPTLFPMSGGRTGLMGEAGPEAIMPLKRGPNGKLGVEGGSNVTVQQTFNFAANGDESVKRIIAEAAPKIANLTQKQILDSRRRGGTMKATFG